MGPGTCSWQGAGQRPATLTLALDPKDSAEGKKGDTNLKAKILWNIVALLCIVMLTLLGAALGINVIVIGKGRHWVVGANMEQDRYAIEQAGIWQTEGAAFYAGGGQGAAFDCILVLGAKVQADGELSWVLSDRCDVGIRAYESGLANKLLLSGDHGQINYDEVSAMQRHCQQAGVRSDDIFLDHAGFSTYDSMVRAKAVFGARKILVVTQRFHLYRALYMARALGLEAYGLDSALHVYGPRTERTNFVREMAARVKGWYNIEIGKPAPKYLGEPIDLRGSGRVTHE